MTLLRLFGMLVYYLGLARLVIYCRRGVPRIVAYHSCEPNESDFTRGLECNTPPALLAKHLVFFATHYSVVPLASIVSGAAGSALAITFDDAYRSVHEHAFPLLMRHRFPASVFVTTEAIGGDALIWVNALTWLLNVGGEAARVAATRRLGESVDAPIERIVDQARKYCTPEERRDLLHEMARAGGVNQPTGGARLYLGWEEASEMGRAGISFGNHTATHPDLALLDGEAAREEIVRAGQSLADHLPGHVRIPALAFPFGSYDVRTLDVAVSCGIRVALSIGGTHQRGNPLQLARTPISNASVARLFADLEIAEPMKALVGRMFARFTRRAPKRPGDWHSAPAETRAPSVPQV